MSLAIDDFHPQLDRRQTGELTRLIGELDHFRGHWRKLQEIRAERLAQLRQVTTIESTGSSTRIEGAELSNAEVANVLAGIRIDSFRERDEAEVRGYGELLNLIFEAYRDIALSENHVKQLHGVLLKYSERDAWHRGQYKKFDNDVAVKDGDRVVEIIFRTTSPFETAARMEDLIRATNEALVNDSLHPLVIIARFIVDFLAVHPFQDGNGRLARAMTVLLLLRTGYDYVPYASLERIIEENKQSYYAALRESQLAMRDNPPAFGSWLFFFLRALKAQQRALQAKLDVERSLLEVSDVQQRIADFIAAQTRATVKEIAESLTLQPRAVRYHVGILEQRGVITARGGRKGRFYTQSADTRDAAPVASPLQGTNAIVAEILQRGGRISRSDLIALVQRHGYDPRTVGILHGRRLAHLRRDPATRDSVLTARGEAMARQYLFAARLAQRAQHVDVESGEEPKSPSIA
jgi:Fic family protein